MFLIAMLGTIVGASLRGGHVGNGVVSSSGVGSSVSPAAVTIATAAAVHSFDTSCHTLLSIGAHGVHKGLCGEQKGGSSCRATWTCSTVIAGAQFFLYVGCTGQGGRTVASTSASSSALFLLHDSVHANSTELLTNVDAYFVGRLEVVRIVATRIRHGGT